MEQLRLAELLAGLSLVSDAGMGLEPGEAARAALVAMELAAAVGAAEPADVYYTTLLQHVGCTAYAHEAAALLGGDEIAVKAAAMRTDFSDPRDIVRTYLPNLAPTARPLMRLRAAGTAAVRGRAIVRGYSRANCEVAARTAERVGLGSGVVAGLTDVYEQWDGKGGARGLRAEAIAFPARIAQVAVAAALFHRIGGTDVAMAAVRRRAGTALDPGLAGALCSMPRRILGVLDIADPVEAAVAAEPAPWAQISEFGLDRACRAFGEVVDLKTPLHHGHATGVAELAAAGGERLGMSPHDVKALRRAALLHDLGRAAVSNVVWERHGRLTWSDQERVRLHAYHSERVLARCGPLVPLAQVVGMHHERLDGSGYHRQAAGASISFPSRVLAAADAFQAMTQPRAHRPAHSKGEAAQMVVAEARAGRLDVDAVRAVVESAGESVARISRSNAAGLTERQIAVLRLVAEGLSNAQIAQRLVISPRTAEHHVQDVYARIGVSSRAAAALFGMEHDLLVKQDW
jgi:HD-GYP domain-containing protein (c-di-GMP phosphodiesterase class II)